MNKLLKPLAIVGLILTIAPPLFLFLGTDISLATTKNTMIAGMILWFVSATPWLTFQKDESSQP